MSQGAPAPQTSLRAMRWQDLAEVAALEQRLYPRTAWSEANWWAELAQRPRRHYLVACSGADGVLGYAGLDVSGESADVMTIAVHPGAQGRGLGATILRGLHRDAAARGVRTVLLEVRADNAAARRLYARHGYEHLRTRAGYYRTEDAGGDVDAVVLRVSLDAEPGSGGRR